MRNLTKNILLASVLITSFAPATFAAKVTRDAAVEVCSARVSEELGKGEMKVLRAKKKRNTFKVRILKFQDGTKKPHAYIDCNVNKGGDIDEFETEVKA
ncbi:hypothetical protein [Kordiimonas sp. SCSIO 12610]|uniref:hypothetical protein n=1 Tax=Kordiimonas sp. SCSIO 12610 TaxID=2829597 RepID=UPI00210D0AF7|nr:hypothetical protein [Kordiimonas sp. SCSIO 12610]UTW53946.1 hypothetical protein KFF44_08835 [Kordiimonas sp. SCSIO 12610]